MTAFPQRGALKIVYSPHYNISFFGVEQCHPFDAKKYGRAWQRLQGEFGARLDQHHVVVDRPVTDEELSWVHTGDYLNRLRRPRELAAALELPLLRWLPRWLIAWRVLNPMRWAVRGSVLAAKAALQAGGAVNLSGGYHHAKPAHGEGFCLFSDAALIVQQLRRENLLQPEERILYVDLDAHQGNGVCHQFMCDPRVMIFDMYNRDNYPANDQPAQRRIDVNIPLAFGCRGEIYLATLRERLSGVLDSLAGALPRLAIYNAGTDVFAGDRLGGLGLSEAEVLERDVFVMETLRKRHIPFVMLLSGGYSSQSFRLVANTVANLIRAEGVAQSDQKET